MILDIIGYAFCGLGTLAIFLILVLVIKLLWKGIFE